MKVFKAPESIANITFPSIFLAGSIEMGKAEMWQDKVIDLIDKERKRVLQNGGYCSDYSIINPRRDDWNSSWEQKYSNPEFNQQVSWELFNIKEAHIILFYFDPSTKSPITLMELGYAIGLKKKIVVVCEEPFYRKGNVDVICHLNKIPQFSTIEEAVNHILK